MKKESLYSIGIILILGLLGLWYFKKPEQPQAPVSNNPLITAEESNMAEDWEEYRNEGLKFAFLYPTEMKVEETNEGGGAKTIVFEDPTNLWGFQIFIVPYKENKISEEQFKRDVPSGVRNDLKEFQVDGVTANAFHSEDALLGETSEVWFVYDGYLYEMTTLKSQETLLEDVIGNWEFI